MYLVQRLIAVLLAVVMLALPALGSADAGPGLMVDDKPAILSAGTLMENGRLLAPLPSMAAALGATVTFDKATQMATVERGHHSIVLWAGSARAVVNGAVESMDVGPRMNGDVLWVPVRFVAEHLGGYVTYDPAKNQVVIETGKSLLVRGLVATGTADNVKQTGALHMQIEDAKKPAASPDMVMSMDWTAHLSNKQMLMTMKLAFGPVLPFGEITMGLKDEKVYIKNPTTGRWEASTMTGADLRSQTSTSSKSLDELLNASVVSVLGTEELGGVKLLKIALDVREGAPLALGDTLPGGSGAVPLPENMRLKVDYFRAVYWINPANNLIHRSTLNMAVTMSMPDQHGQDDSATLHMTLETRTTPATEPVQFPADFPATK